MPAPNYNGRRHEIYFPDTEDLQRWRAVAKKNHLSLSKFIYETVENSLLVNLEPKAAISRADEMSILRQENNRLRIENKEKSARIEKLETDLFNLRHHDFMDPNPKYAKFTDELIDLLKSGGTWSGREILKSMQIDPKNADSIRIVSNQLAILADLKFIEETEKGWRWLNE